jgi:hypothetical protein
MMLCIFACLFVACVALNCSVYAWFDYAVLNSTFGTSLTIAPNNQTAYYGFQNNCANVTFVFNTGSRTNDPSTTQASALYGLGFAFTPNYDWSYEAMAKLRFSSPLFDFVLVPSYLDSTNSTWWWAMFPKKPFSFVPGDKFLVRCDGVNTTLHLSGAFDETLLPGHIGGLDGIQLSATPSFYVYPPGTPSLDVDVTLVSKNVLNTTFPSESRLVFRIENLATTPVPNDSSGLSSYARWIVTWPIGNSSSHLFPAWFCEYNCGLSPGNNFNISGMCYEAPAYSTGEQLYTAKTWPANRCYPYILLGQPATEASMYFTLVVRTDYYTKLVPGVSYLTVSYDGLYMVEARSWNVVVKKI